MTATSHTGSDAREELITFRVGGQDFSMAIMKVKEIKSWSGVTMLPHAPSDVLGVMNLRGAVVPIVDLSARLGLGACESAPRNVVIIATVGAQVVGLLVSSVIDIVGVKPADIQTVPEIDGGGVDTFVRGIVLSGDRTLRILNVESLAASFARAAA